MAIDNMEVNKELLDQRIKLNPMAQFLDEQIVFNRDEKVDESAWETLLDYENPKTRQGKLTPGMGDIVPIPPYKNIWFDRVLVEIVQEDYSSIKNVDMVVIPCTSVLYPHYEGPRQLFLKGGRLEINKQLKTHLLEQKGPQQLTQCLDIDVHEFYNNSIKKLLFVTAPTEQWRNSDFYREVNNYKGKLQYDKKQLQDKVDNIKKIEVKTQDKEKLYNKLRERYMYEKNKGESERDQLYVAEMEKELKEEEGLIEDLRRDKHENTRKIDKLKQKIDAKAKDLPELKIKWHQKMRCFFKSFMWNILDKFHESTLQTLVLPPLAMDMETELFSPQTIANMMLGTLQDFLISKVKFDKHSPIFHIKIVCERDKEFLAFKKGYDQLNLDFFVSQGLIQKY